MDRYALFDLRIMYSSLSTYFCKQSGRHKWCNKALIIGSGLGISSGGFILISVNSCVTAELIK